jgi:hypothetical protein
MLKRFHVNVNIIVIFCIIYFFKDCEYDMVWDDKTKYLTTFSRDGCLKVKDIWLLE